MEDYKFSFKKIQQRVSELSADDRERYYRGVQQFIDSGALDIHVEELIRYFVAEIAFKLNDLEQITAYRICLKFIQEYEKNLRFDFNTHNKKANPKDILNEI